MFLQQKTRLFASFGMPSPLICCTNTLSPLCNGVNTAPKYSLLGLMPCCRIRLRTVCELFLCNPVIPAAVVDAATVRFRRWNTRMYRSCPGLCEVFHSFGGIRIDQQHINSMSFMICPSVQTDTYLTTTHKQYVVHVMSFRPDRYVSNNNT